MGTLQQNCSVKYSALFPTARPSLDFTYLIFIFTLAGPVQLIAETMPTSLIKSHHHLSIELALCNQNITLTLVHMEYQICDFTLL